MILYIRFLRIPLLFFLVLFFSIHAIGQVPTNINSGNPNFPFPQFLEYKKGKTLAKYNAEGVTHADMEKAIREAFQVMANRFYYTGVVVDGVKYIRSNDGCPYDCAEGEGYGLLAAAYMGDKTTFNGIWMRVHDDMVTRSYRYSDGVMNFPAYRYGEHTIKEESGDAAADGDYDIGLALLMATKQWGPLSGVQVANGSGGKKNMSYLEEALNIIADFVDTTEIRPLGNPGVIDGWVSGHIGIDGYPKGGNTFKEVTDWANVPGNIPRPSCEVFTGCGAYPGFGSYIAPAYFRSFAKFMSDNNSTTWNIEQFKRAEASSDWLMAQSVAQGRLPFAGQYSITGSAATFGETDPKQGKADGESFRMAWRTVLNGMWRGDGIYTWNPINHTYSLGSNTAMQDNANKLGPFLKNNGICSTLGSSPDPVSSTVNHKGISQIRQYHLSDGTSPSGNWTNYTLGTSSPSAVLYGDEELIAELYRQCELKWDDKNVGLPENDTIIVNSTPKYFHGWFRLLGMLTLSGNLHAPEDMVANANMKVYLSVDKTFAFTGDQITYTLDYKNYGKTAAADVVIQIPVPNQYKVINAGGGTVAGNTLTYNIGTVQGFNSTDGISPTTGKKAFVVKVLAPQVTPKICQTATITSSNGSGWTSNEYPNNATYSMQRNCVDILAERSLKIEKTADKTEVNPGKDVTFTLNFSNSSDAGWLNGGRQNVNFSYAYAESGPNSYFHLFRNWNNAQEAYVNLSNYRVSYFMFDNVNNGIFDATTNPYGWSLIGKNLQTGNYADFDFKGETIPVGDDNGKKWDQRLIIRFPPDITAPTHTVLSHLGNRFQLHKGTLRPIWYSVQMESNPPSPLFAGRVQDDWSFKSTAFKMSIGSGAEPYFLIGPNYANPNSTTGLVMDRFDKDACTAIFTPDKIYDKLLVEEFDGYTWRRIAGEGPLPGREMYTVVVVDTIPLEFKFVKFTDDIADGVKAQLLTSGGREIIKWSVPKLLVGVAGDFKYVVTAQGACPGMTDKTVSNVAWIYSSTDSPVSANADVKITCSFVPPPVTGTTMTKVSDKTNYALNEDVSYKIKFKQTIGTISRPALTDATRWTTIDGSATDVPKFTATAIDFDNGKPGVFIKEKYSHGKNGTLIADVDHDGQETFGFVFRYQNGQRPVAGIQGIYVEMQLAYWSTQANIKVYENGILKADIVQEAYAAPFTQAKIKFELTDGVMKIWLNDISGLPFKTISGLTNTTAGYAGFAVGDAAKSASVWSKPKILGWDAHFDSAFDVEISDPLPAALTFVSAANGGTYTAPRVKWPKIAGPVLYGDSVEYSLIAKLTACPASEKIINVAYVNVFGVAADSIGAQNIVNCGGNVVPTTLEAGSIGGKQLVCNGNTPNKLNSLQPASGGTAPYTYQWETSPDSTVWTAIATATDSVYTPGTLTNSMYYRRKVTDATTSVYTASVKVTVYADLDAGAIGSDQTLCGTTTAAAFTEVASVSGGTGNYVYQWQSSEDNTTFNDITSATNAVYNPGTVTTTKYFRRTVTSGVCSSKNTSSVAVTVYPAISAGSVGKSQTICYNQAPVGFTEIVPPSGGTGSFTYQWQSSQDSITFANVAGETTKDYAPGAITSTTFYQRQVFSGTCPAASSTNAITVTSVTPGTIGSSQAICYNTVPNTLSNFTLPSGGTPPYDYQWQSSVDSLVFNDITGETFTTYTPGALTTTIWYRRNVTGTTCGTLNSLAVKITVYQELTPGTIGSDQQICSSTAPDSIKNITFPAGGSQSYTYQWQQSANNLSWTKIPGATAASYKPSALTATSYFRRQVVSATCDTLVTASVKIEVLPAVSASITLTDPGPVCASENVTLVAAVTNEGSNPGYQWYLNGVLTGETTASYTNNALKDGDSVRVILSSDEKCAVNSPVSSNKITVSISTTVIPSVVINTTPGNSICAGTPVQFSIGARSGQGNAPTYKWFLNNVATGVTDTVYKPVGLADDDSVKVEMTSNSSCATITTVFSQSIAMQVSPNATPDVTIGVDQAAICKGAKAMFTIQTRANGGAAPLYQWQLNGNNITGSTDTVFSSTALNNGDQVRLIMTSDLTCVTKQKDTSLSITITVNPTRTVNIVLSDPGVVCDNTPVTFKATTSNGGTNPVFAWLVNGAPAVPAPAASDSVFTAVLKNQETVQVSVTSSLNCAVNPAASSNIVTMQVNSGPKASGFSYAGSPYCKGGTTAIPTIGGTGISGTFSSTSGLSINGTSGVVDIPLSTTGTYIVKNKVTSGCGTDSTTTGITIQAAQKADFSYTETPYCQNAGTATVTMNSGGVAGTFTATGVPVNAITGDVDLSASTAGTYTVTNTIAASGSCPQVKATTSITITGVPDASFSYSGSPYCKGSGNAVVTLGAGSSAGIFSIPSGLSISSTTGTVNLVTSTAGTYTVTNTITAAGGCPDVTATAGITITAPDVADFSYTGTPYCQVAGSASPAFTGGGKAGVFTATGLTLNAATGVVNLTASTPGTYTVTNTIAASGSCPQVKATASIAITSSNPKADFSYTGSPYCQSTGSAAVALNPSATAGAFSSTSADLSINGTNGTVNLTASKPGSYTVTNTIVAAGGCGSATASAPIVVTAPGNAGFGYSANNYCQDVPNPAPVFTGTGQAGVFSSKVGLVIDPVTGIIDLSGSAEGTYVVSNTIAASGGCATVVAADTLSVTAIPLLTVSPDVRIATGRSTVLTANGASNYTWSPATGLSCTVCQRPVARPSQTTTYAVIADTKGCKAEGIVIVTIEECGEVFIPNAFNPGSSGQNAILRVYGNCIETMQFMIYDRWGEKVFEATDPAQFWTGDYRGAPMNSGEFVYVFKATLLGGEEINKKGNISLVR